MLVLRYVPLSSHAGPTVRVHSLLDSGARKSGIWDIITTGSDEAANFVGFRRSVTNKALLLQVTAEAVKVLKVVEKCVPDVTFNFQEHLLGGVSPMSCPCCSPVLPSLTI